MPTLTDFQFPEEKVVESVSSHFSRNSIDDLCVVDGTYLGFVIFNFVSSITASVLCTISLRFASVFLHNSSSFWILLISFSIDKRRSRSAVRHLSISSNSNALLRGSCSEIWIAISVSRFSEVLRDLARFLRASNSAVIAEVRLLVRSSTSINFCESFENYRKRTLH